MVTLRELKPRLSGLPVQSCQPDQDAFRLAGRLLQQNIPFALVSLPPGRWEIPGWLVLTELSSTQTLAAGSEFRPHTKDSTEVWLFGFEWLAHNHLQQNNATRAQPRSPAGVASCYAFKNVQLFRGQVASKPTTQRGTPTAVGAMPDTYADSIHQIQSWLQTGDLYQFNLTRRFSQPGNALSLWTCWQDGCYSFLPPFASFVHIPGQVTVASLSPEEWISSDGTTLCTAPIKGTGSQEAGDLETSKNRAEHTMIVDLERNDMMRVCQAESITTAPFCRPVEFGGISHLVSLVYGTLRPDTSFQDIVTALGPGGSVTGAPKIAMLQKVRQVENDPRSWYCGGIGIRTAETSFSFNLPIRTAWIEKQKIVYHSGGGIVSDSTAEGEWQELHDKLYWISSCD